MNSNCHSPMFNFDSTLRTLSVFSNDIYNVGTYTLRVRGEVVPYDSKWFNIQVIVTKSCNDMFMTRYSIGNKVFTLF